MQETVVSQKKLPTGRRPVLAWKKQRSILYAGSDGARGGRRVVGVTPCWARTRFRSLVPPGGPACASSGSSVSQLRPQSSPLAHYPKLSTDSPVYVAARASVPAGISPLDRCAQHPSDRPSPSPAPGPHAPTANALTRAAERTRTSVNACSLAGRLTPVRSSQKSHTHQKSNGCGSFGTMRMFNSRNDLA